MPRRHRVGESRPSKLKRRRRITTETNQRSRTRTPSSIASHKSDTNCAFGRQPVENVEDVDEPKTKQNQQPSWTVLEGRKRKQDTNGTKNDSSVLGALKNANRGVCSGGEVATTVLDKDKRAGTQRGDMKDKPLHATLLTSEDNVAQVSTGGGISSETQKQMSAGASSAAEGFAEDGMMISMEQTRGHGKSNRLKKVSDGFTEMKTGLEAKERESGSTVLGRNRKKLTTHVPQEHRCGRREKQTDVAINPYDMDEKKSHSEHTLDIARWTQGRKLPSPSVILGLESIIPANESNVETQNSIDTQMDRLAWQSEKKDQCVTDIRESVISHPILGRIVIPSEASASEARSAIQSNGPFGHHTSAADAHLSFPVFHEPTSRGQRRGRFFQGDGICIPLDALSFPGHPRHHLRQQSKSDRKAIETDGLITNSQGVDDSVPAGKVLGKIRIVSERGATVRETYDIDESELVLGRLEVGDVRCYVEQRWLPPPPAEEFDDDEEEDDHCVGVMRYRVCLVSADGTCCRGGEGTKNGEHEFGWISDRGRFANDPYKIAIVM